MESLISIIIPLYNRENLVIETLKSIKAQSHTNWECIIVDDHSTDNSYQAASDYVMEDNRFKLLKRPNDRIKGANACRNYGFEQSSGQYINWFDSDDIMHRDYLLATLTMIKQKEPDAVIAKTVTFKDNINDIIGKEHRTHLSDYMLEDFLSLKMAWYLQGVLWNREFLVGKDLFNEFLLAGQDRDFHARMLLHEPKLIVIDKYLIYYRKHENSITGTIDNIRNKELKVSHLKSVSKLVHKIDEANKLSTKIRITLFNAMIKYLPFTLDNKSDFDILRSLLKKLSFFNYSIMIGWLKFYSSKLSYKLFGKGSRLLR